MRIRIRIPSDPTKFGRIRIRIRIRLKSHRIRIRDICFLILFCNISTNRLSDSLVILKQKKRNLKNTFVHDSIIFFWFSVIMSCSRRYHFFTQGSNDCYFIRVGIRRLTEVAHGNETFICSFSSELFKCQQTQVLLVFFSWSHALSTVPLRPD